jgi:putative tricarboxylic transport membrane protein
VKLIGLLLGLCLMATGALAQSSWRPTKPVEIWVTFGKGAHADIWARDFISIIEANRLADTTFQVVNIPRGAGVEAFPKFGKIEGDDHKLMLVLPNVFTVPLYRKGVEFDLASMTPIARMGAETLAIWVKSEQRDVQNIAQLVKLARAKGKNFRMAGPPLGTPRAMLAEMVMALYGIDGTYVGIKRIGNTARVLAEQDFDATIHNPSELVKLKDPASIKPIAFLSEKRFKNYLNVPTLPETGMAITYQASRVIIGPRGMSAPARAYYTELFRKVFESPQWQKIRKEKGHIDGFLSGQPLEEFLITRINKHVRWKMAVELLGAR